MATRENEKKLVGSGGQAYGSRACATPMSIAEHASPWCYGIMFTGAYDTKARVTKTTAQSKESGQNCFLDVTIRRLCTSRVYSVEVYRINSSLSEKPTSSNNSILSVRRLSNFFMPFITPPHLLSFQQAPRPTTSRPACPSTHAPARSSPPPSPQSPAP